MKIKVQIKLEQKIKNLQPLTDEDFTYLEDIFWVKLGNKDEYYTISKITEEVPKELTEIELNCLVALLK